eukprot:Skav201589  [mRNA]  locus=scaffold152:536907:541522:+ [translate_table: standard]
MPAPKPAPESPPNDLEQALGDAVVEELKDQNAQLRLEVERLRQQQTRIEDSSNSSWSVVPGLGPCRDEAGGDRPRSRSGCRTPRNPPLKKMVAADPRFTPNGTQVPPEPGSEKSIPLPPPLPPVPPPPLMIGRADVVHFGDYERHDGGGRQGYLGDRSWQPRNPEAMAPHEARAFWLEKEVRSLHAMLHAQHSDPRFRDSSYWSQPWYPSRDDGVPGRDSSSSSATQHRADDAAHGHRAQEDRAQAAAASVHGDRAQEDRARSAAALAHGVRAQDDRARFAASADLGDRAPDDRACMAAAAALGERAPEGRASAAAVLGVEPPQDRASIRRHGEVWQPVRAAHDDLPLRGRAGAMEPGERHVAASSMMGPNPAAPCQAAREINERDEYNQKIEQYKKAEGGYGFGYPGATTAWSAEPPLSALDPRSPYWIPPPNNGQDIKLVNDDNDGTTTGPRDGRALVGWEGGSNNKIELPELPADATPLSLGDWLTVITPLMRDVSQVSAIWWERTKSRAMELYNTWKQCTPLDRVGLTPVLPRELQDARFQRTEQRGTSLLLRAIPADQQQAIIAAREMNSTAILFRLLIRFQPGGSGEKTLLLQKLTKLDESTDMLGLTGAIRGWRRHYQRAVEVGAVVPDGTLLLHALEAGIQQIALKDSQATFRLAQARAQLGVDEQPTQDRVWRLSQCILAEAETLSLMSSSASSTPVPATPITPIKVKQLDASPGAPGGPLTPATNVTTPDRKPKTNPQETPCRWFSSSGGCRAGKTCKFLHSWDQVNDKASRCAGSGGGSGGGNGGAGPGRGRGKDFSKDGRKGGKGAGGSTSRPNKSTTPGASSGTPTTNSSDSGQKPAVQEMKVDNKESGADGPNNTSGGGKPGAGDLLAEATNLLRSLRMPMNLNVMKVSECGTGRDHVLLDSGATHGLRPAFSEEEWQQAHEVSVSLADGRTTSLRLKLGTRLLLSDPRASMTTTTWIVPMGGLTEMQYKLTWTDGQCRLQDPKGVEIPVELQGGCPVVEMAVGKTILEEMEAYQRAQHRRLQMIRALVLNAEEVPKEQMSMDLALLVKLKDMFPSLPMEVLERTIPAYDQDLMNDLGAVLPWNRRKRKRLQRATNVIVHFYSGASGTYWEKALNDHNTEVLCLDLLAPTPSNMHEAAVFWYVMSLMMSGRVKAILAGPPCRTVSALRFQGDQGPGVVRNEDHPYGCPGITPKEAELVLDDTALWLRVLLAYALCEDSRQDLRPTAPATALVLEQPEDPANYRSPGDVAQFQYMSMWRTQEWREFQDRFGIHLVSFDQGTMGHEVRKPTSLAVTVDELRQLDGMRGGPMKLPPKKRSAMTMQERCNHSKEWASWAPGLKAALVVALRRWIAEVDCSSVVTSWGSSMAPQTGPAVRPLGPLELQRWKTHYLNDHYPSRRDCRHCVQAAGRGKPHRRLAHPESYTLAIDLSGKMTEGIDQTGKNAHYIFMGCYTFPVDRQGRALLTPPSSSEDGGDQPLPAAGEHLGPSPDHEEGTFVSGR